MTSIFSKNLLLSLIFCSSIPSFAFAQNTENPATEMTLDPVVITAQRYQTKEIETSYSVEILDENKIKAIGASNAQETLKYALGTNYMSYGPGGNSRTTSYSAIAIRGVEKGTLILINGRPVNARGLSFLESIPTGNIERIEVIRGGGSVLYGSEALGGVINIITKKKSENSAYYEMGNYGRINTGTHLQEGKLGITYDYRKWGDVGRVSLNKWQSIVNQNPGATYYNMNYKGSKSNSVLLTYAFDDQWSFLYSYDQTKTNWLYSFYNGSYLDEDLTGKAVYSRTYNYMQNMAQLNFNGKNIKASLFYSDLAVVSRGRNYRRYTGAAANIGQPYQGTYNADERNRNLGFDIQYTKAEKKNNYLIGLTSLYEAYKNRQEKSAGLHRYNYSIYSSLEHAFTDKTKAILSTRYSWQTGSPSVKNLDKFTPQLQLNQKIGKNEYIYITAGMSYKMPTITENFGSGGKVIGNADLKAQTGQNYELGWKKNINNHFLRAAFFTYKIKDKISSKQITSDTYRYFNEDAKNTGLELEYGYSGAKGFNYTIGAAIGDPKTRAEDVHVSRVNKWERAYDRYELNGDIGYKTGNWTFNLHTKYIFGRVHSSVSTEAFGPEKMRPALYTTLSIRYQLDKKQEIYFKAENLFDRKDITTNISAEYYYTPFNFLLGYNIKF